MTTRLLIVDDHALMRAGLRMLLESQSDFAIVGECENGGEAIRRAQELQPDVVLMDITLPDMLGFEATRAIRKLAPQAAILALTMHESEQYFFEMVNAGASGYVPKRAAPDELLNAIRAVAQGGMYLYPSLARTLVQDYLKHADSGESKPPSDGLTERELEVVKLIADGLSNAEVGQRLTISVKTVERHRANIFAKLNLHSRTDLVKYAIRKGLIDIEDHNG
ncbi:MAG: response regulator transcription factor [Chloroflexi bacterium]|nr:response regulator transcription factor [Chloroflexota bacterium]